MQINIGRVLQLAETVRKDIAHHPWQQATTSTQWASTALQALEALVKELDGHESWRAEAALAQHLIEQIDSSTDPSSQELRQGVETLQKRIFGQILDPAG